MNQRYLEFRVWLRENPASGVSINSGYQSEIILYKSPYGNYVHKRPLRKFILLAVINTYLIKREYKALKSLRGINNIPNVYGYDKGIFMDHYNAKNLREVNANNEDLSLAFYDSLLETIHEIHARGIVHCDLKRKENILKDNTGKCLIVDFGICIYKSNLFFKLFFKLLVQSDLNAYIKLKYKNKLDSLSKADLEIYNLTQAERLLKKLRALKKKWLNTS